VEDMTQGGSKAKVKGATQGVLDAAGEKIKGLTTGEDEFEEADEEREPAPRRRRRREE